MPDKEITGKATTPNLDFIFVMIAVFLAIFVKFWESGLGVSSATYGAIANNLVHDNQWFHLHMQPKSYDPFVDQPYLVLWLDAILFKLLGASAQTIRLLSSVAGFFTFASMYSICRKQFDEITAVLACICLLTVNIFMNFTSSGWLDMPTIAFVWTGFYFLFRKSKLLGGLLLGCAVISKGVCAVAVVPIFFWYVFKKENRKDFFLLALATLAPILVFTFLHYQSEGFLFWKNYFLREGIEQNSLQQQTSGISQFFWYPIKMLAVGHVITILGLVGCYQLYMKQHKSFALLIMAQVVFHIFLYSISSRHYPQYVIHVMPWLAVSSAFVIRKQIKQISARTISFGIMALMVLFFVVVDLFPIRVHSGNENPFRAFTSTLKIMKDNRNVYYYADPNDQLTWEDLTSYISWYWDRKPIISSVEVLLNKINTDEPEALGLMYTNAFLDLPKNLLKNFSHIKVCMWNDSITLLANQNICTEEVQSFRDREPPHQVFTR